MIRPILTFLIVCLSTSFVCTAIKEDEDERLLFGTLRLLGVMSAGIVGFALVVQLLTAWAN